MSLRLTDRAVSTFYKGLETSPAAQVGDAEALQLLSLVGDRSGASAKKVLGQLLAPGMTREAQVALVQKGLSAGEKKDLTAILDAGDVPLTDSARALLGQVLGRVTPPPANGDLYIEGDQKSGLHGVSRAGDAIEAINLSTAPMGRLHLDDTVVLGQADGSGTFAGLSLSDMAEGDKVRIRARHSDGTVGDWQVVEIHGTGKADTRNAQVNVSRVTLADAGGGKVSVTNLEDGSRQVSEPGATLQLTNLRTGEKTLVVITDTGSFPSGFTVNGQKGDAFGLAVTDGKNDVALAKEVGRVTVPGGAPANGDLVPDPAMHKDQLNADGTPRYEKHRFTGPLFKDGVSPTDVQQGYLGDCYVPSAFAAMAKACPEALENLIHDNGDGTYTVTFKQKDWATGKFQDVPVKVDGDLYVRPYGGPIYGASLGSDKGEKTMELWFPLVEKAYAQWKGSYDRIGNGGPSSNVFEAVLGRPGRNTGIKYTGPDAIWSQLTRAVDAHQPVSAGTYGESQDALYTNTGIYADHSYSVLGYKEVNGQKLVTLRNPWGESEPSGNGANDGIFDLPLDQFCKLYQTLMTA